MEQNTTDVNGGIDLTSDQALTVRNGGAGGIKFQIDPVKIRQWQNTAGFMPVIINVQPLKNVPSFMGLKV